MLYAIVAMLVIILDQWVKYWTSVNISINSTGETFLPGIMSLVNVHNDGAAFSLFSGGEARIYFIILTGVFTVAVILMLATRFVSRPVSCWSLVLVTAGGLSNCIDRVIYGYVQDMFKVELFNFAVFNVADIFITVFCLIFVLDTLFGKDIPEDDYDDEFEEEDDEEEDRPSLFRKKNKKAEVYEEEFKPVKPAKPEKADKPAKPEKADKPAKSRKARQSKYEEEYEQYKAARAARQQNGAAAPAAPKSAPAYDPADPFAEWERANARVESQQRNTPEVRVSAAASVPKARPQAPQTEAARPAVPTARPAQPVQPAAPAPVAAPQPAPAKKADSSDFSLDDILAEFK